MMDDCIIIIILWSDNMSTNYCVYDSRVYVKCLGTENALYNAMILIGISRNEDILNCTDYDKRYNLIKQHYNNDKPYSLCRRGVRFICAILKDKEVKVSVRKCMKYVCKQKGKSFYTDITITKFAESVMQIFNSDATLMELFTENINSNCNTYMAGDIPILKDCVQHLFGFQYECLKDIVKNRKHPKSRKSLALKKCLEEMDEVTERAGYPKCEQFRGQTMV